MHLIAFNPQRAGNMGRISTLTLADYDRLIRENWLRELVSEIRQGNKLLKKQLPFRSPHYYAFKDDRRCQSAIQPESFLFQTCVDIDDADKVPEAIDRARELDEQPGKWRGKLLHMEYSASKKLHIDLRLPLGMTIEQTQKEYGDLMGIDYDHSCVTPERIIFITPIEDEIYRSEHWYEKMSDDDLRMYRDALASSKRYHALSLAPSPVAVKAPVTADDKHSDKASEITPVKAAAKIPERDLDRCMRKDLLIFDLCQQEAGLEHVDINAIGSRHTCLQSIMSVGAARLMSCQELEAVVAKKMPEYYAQDDDCRRLIHDFYNRYHDESKLMSTACQRILALAEQKVSGGSEAADARQKEPKPEKKAWEKINARRLPMGLKESLTGVPENMYMPVLCSVLTIAGALADQVEVKYCNGNYQRLGLMSIIVGEQASGKSVCKDVIDVWKQPLEDEDAANRKIEEDWRHKKYGRKASERAPEDPKTIIRIVPPTVSNSTLLRRLKNSQGHCLYSFGEELDTLRKSNGAGSWSNKYDIYRVAFDNGEWGQDYNGEQAESGVVKVAYNWTMLGTYGALRKCFRIDNVENGLSSRMIIAEMPNNDFAKMPVYGHRSEADNKNILTAVTKLRAQSGYIDTPRLRKAIAKWVEEKRIVAMKNDDKVMDVYRKRSAVIGFRAGCIYRLLNDKEDKKCVDFALMMAEYVLFEQMRIFGNLLQQSWDDFTPTTGIYKSANNRLFDQLPNTFTLEEVMRLKGVGCKEHSVRTVISRWKRNKLINPTGKDSWVKI
ncbi:MAG: DUF3987 domain-containing protein [Prevotellaceae bacterium]|nr:DUF3987 domain-containing protein [Prevotellaceae bacterium]